MSMFLEYFQLFDVPRFRTWRYKPNCLRIRGLAALAIVEFHGNHEVFREDIVLAGDKRLATPLLN